MVFEFSIGGYPGPFFNLHLINGQLKCTYTILEEVRIEIHWIDVKKNEKWNDALAYLNTRKWNREYIDNQIVDGTSWEILFESGNVAINSHGSNVYPSGFRKFMKLINELTAEIGVSIY